MNEEKYRKLIKWLLLYIEEQYIIGNSFSVFRLVKEELGIDIETELGIKPRDIIAEVVRGHKGVDNDN